MPVFALFDIAPERMSAFVTYILSIVGGGVAGYVAAIFAGKLFDRVVLGKGKRSADVLHKIFRWLAGLAVAVLVAIYMFPGGGGGKGIGEGNQEGPDKAGNPTGGPDPKASPTPPTPKGHVLDPDEKARVVIRLEILGGSDLKMGTDFYREVGKEEQLTLAEVEKLVNDRKRPGLGVAIEYRLTRYANDPTFQGLTTLRAWGIEKKVSVDPADKNGN